MLLLLLLPFMVVGYPNQTFILSNDVQFSYMIADTTFVTYTLTCKTQYWCAIGFGSSHPNADMIRLQMDNNVVTVQDLMSKPGAAYTVPNVDAEQDVTLIQGWQNGTHLYGQFYRKLVTDDPSDYPIPLMVQIQMQWAIGDAAISQLHYDQGAFNITYGSQASPSCHYMCQQCIGPLASDCTICAVDDVAPLNGYCTLSDLDELYGSLEIITGDFKVYWGYIIPGYIDFMLEVSLCDWFAIGFGPNMQGTDMLLFQMNPVSNFRTGKTDYTLDVHDMWSYTNVIPDDDYMRGGTNDYELLGYQLKNNHVLTKVRRAMNTGDPNDIVFNKVDLRVSYAFGNNTDGKLTYHQSNRGVVTLELSSSDTRDLMSEWGIFVQRGHTILMFVFWGVLSDVGVFFARYLKSYPKYAKVHGMLFIFQSIVTYFFVFSMIRQQRDKIQEIDAYDDMIIAHFALGLIVLVVMTAQLFFGMMVKNNLESMNGSERVYRLKGLHQIFGYFLYIVTKINVAIGMHLHQPDLLFWFYAWYILLGLVKIVVEMLYLFEVSIFPRKRITYHYIDSDKNYLYERLIEKINNGESRYDLLKEYPKLRYVILREAIYDVSDFNHPGGQFIIDAIRGREIGRYFYGGSHIEKLDIVPHKHSAFAINYIETRYIGDHKNEQVPILYHNESQMATSKVSDRQIWKFKESRKVSTQCSLFIFQSNYFKVRQQLRGVQWFGRYFYIKPYGSGFMLSERPYSVILCLSDENIALRQQIIDYFKAKIIESYFDSTPPPPQIANLRFSNTLCFLIKRYSESQNMSKFVHDTHHKPYEITGPYGLGLELNAHSDGVHYIICNGTGILPFLDLFDYLLKKALYTILHDKCSIQEADRINPYQEDYLNTFGHDFRVILCGAFRNKNEFHGYPIVQDLYFICKSFGLHYFDMMIRMSDTKTDKLLNQDDLTMHNERFDLPFMKSVIKYNPSKVYVCGSPLFEEDVLSLLKQVGVNKRYILVV